MPGSAASWEKLKRDWKLRLQYYRPFIWAGVWTIAIPLYMAGCNACIHRRDDKEWGNAARLQGEATCISAQPMNSRMMLGGWLNTFHLQGKELTSRDGDGCIVGKRYQLIYRIGRTGRLKVESGKLL